MLCNQKSNGTGIQLLLFYFLCSQINASTIYNKTEEPGDDNRLDASFTQCPPNPIVTIYENAYRESYPSQHANVGIRSILQQEGKQTIKSHNTPNITISCRSSRPTTWEHNTPKVVNLGHIIKSVSTSRTALNPLDKTTFCYEANVTLELRPGVYTGWYSCAEFFYNKDNSTFISHQDSTVSNARPSIYFYRNGKSNSTLSLESPIVSLIPSEMGEVRIPSWPNVSNQVVKLWKLSMNLPKFEPRNGWTINVTSDGLLKLPFHPVEGIYKYEYNASEVIFGLRGRTEGKATRILDDPKKTRSDELVIRIRQSTSSDYLFTCDAPTGMLDADTLRLKVLECENSVHCDLLWEASPSYFRTMPLTTDDYRIFSTSKKSGVVICSTKDGTKYQYAIYFPTDKDGVLLNNGTEEENLSEMAIVDLNDAKRHTNYIPVATTVEISCNATQYLFSSGLLLVIEYKNGSVGSTNGMVLDGSGETINGYHRYQWSVNVTSSDIKSYICMAPVINSPQWRNISLPVNVDYGKSPKIRRDHAETSKPSVSFYDTDVDVSLECVAVGKPRPEVMWLKDGHEFSLMYKSLEVVENPTNIGNEPALFSMLSIPKMVDLGADISGKWTCRASNGFQPNDEYHIEVKVERAGFIWIPITIFICAVIVVCVYLWHRYLISRGIILSWEQIEPFVRGNGTLTDDLRTELTENPASLNDAKFGDIGRNIALASGISKRKLLNHADVKEEPQRKLGAGNFAYVSWGTLRNPEGRITPVALKCPQTVDDSEVNKRNKRFLLEELAVYSHVEEHPYLVRFLGAVVVWRIFEEKIIAVLELCEKSLEDYLKNPTLSGTDARNIPRRNANGYVILAQVDTQDLIRWAFQIACGMQHLTSQKIIHRDLAVRNILLCMVNGKLDVKITDFGLSKKLKKEENDYVSQTDKPLPWRHLAPELLTTSGKTFSEATDVWSFGVTLWEMFSLAKEEPYKQYSSSRDDGFQQAVQNNGLSDLLVKPERADDTIDGIIRACCNADPDKRPTFKELARMFLGLLPREYRESIPHEYYEPADEASIYDRLQRIIGKTADGSAKRTFAQKVVSWVCSLGFAKCSQ